MISILVLLPYAVIVISCFSTSMGIKSGAMMSGLSVDNLINNVHNLLKQEYFIPSLINSTIVSAASALIGVLVASAAGYAYHVYSNKRLDTLFFLSIAFMMVPVVTILIPLFLIVKYLGMIDTYFAVIITSISLPFLIFLFRQNNKMFPMELIKSARIDGLGEIKIFTSVYLPCTLPVHMAAILISFFGAWNSVLIPLVILQSPGKFTNALFLDSLGSFWNMDYGVAMVAILFSTLPIIFLFILFHRYIKSFIA